MNRFKSWTLFFSTFLTAAMLMVVVAVAAPIEAGDYNLMLNGDKVVFDAETPVIISDGRTLLPLRFLFDIINEDGTGTVDWDESTGQITLAYGETEVKLWIGDTAAYVNGTQTTIDGAAPIIYKSRTYVPLRFLANAFDMTIYWDDATKTAFAMDNGTLDQIVSLWEGSNSGTMDTKIRAEIAMDMSMIMSAEGETQAVDMKAEGKIEQDYAGKFQYVNMKTSVMGEEVTIEVYDDGEYMYVITDGEVAKTTSAFTLADSIMSQYNITSGLDLERELYTSFKLSDNGGNYTISGNLYLPEEYFSDILSNIEGIGDIVSQLSGVTMKISEPINCKMVINKETDLPISMDMGFALEMATEEYSVEVKYDVKMPKFETDAVFDTVVPEEIIEKAAEI